MSHVSRRTLAAAFLICKRRVGRGSPACRISWRHQSGSTAGCEPVLPEPLTHPSWSEALGFAPYGLLHLCKGDHGQLGWESEQAELPAPLPSLPCLARKLPPGSSLHSEPPEEGRIPKLLPTPASICCSWQLPALLPARGRGFRRLPAQPQLCCSLQDELAAVCLAPSLRIHIHGRRSRGQPAVCFPGPATLRPPSTPKDAPVAFRG